MVDTFIEDYRDWKIFYVHEKAEFHALKGKRRLKPGKNDRWNDSNVSAAKYRIDSDILTKKRKADRDGKPELEFRHWDKSKELEFTTTLVSYTNRGFKTTDGTLEVSYRNRTLLIIPKDFSTHRLHQAVEGLRQAEAEMKHALAQATIEVTVTRCSAGTPEEYAAMEDQIRKEITEAS